MSMLYCVGAPEIGGETLFMSGYQALENLDEETRAVAERVKVHYCLPERGGGSDSDSDDEDTHDHVETEGNRTVDPGSRPLVWDPRVLQSRVCARRWRYLAFGRWRRC